MQHRKAVWLRSFKTCHIFFFEDHFIFKYFRMSYKHIFIFRDLFHRKMIDIRIHHRIHHIIRFPLLCWKKIRGVKRMSIFFLKSFHTAIKTVNLYQKTWDQWKINPAKVYPRSRGYSRSGAKFFGFSQR